MIVLLSVVTSFRDVATVSGTVSVATARLEIRLTYWLRGKGRDSRGRPRGRTPDLSLHPNHNPNSHLEVRNQSACLRIILRPSLSISLFLRWLLNEVLSELPNQLTGVPTSLLPHQSAALLPYPGPILLQSVW